MDDQKQAVIDKLKGANNILVTVSNSPSVDQLSAAIGLTLYLNKLKKHAAAVFSGEVPSTLDFLKPEETIEKNTDSLRDFIISLDKSKADKLRYKVEENVVKIFITPYRTSLSQEDLDFSQGDFNIDVVLALGVHEQQDLDTAITSHGRILHDATVMSLNVQPGPELGSTNWTVPAASSLSELAVEIVEGLGKDEMDGQIATALLTGIVAETERFSNEKTSPETMRMSAELLSAGANQQLVSNELQKDDEPPEASSAPQNGDQPEPPKPDDGTLEIAHQPEAPAEEQPTLPAPEVPEPEQNPEVHDVKQSTFDENPLEAAAPKSNIPAPHYLSEPPVMGGQLTANTSNEDEGETGLLPEAEPNPDMLLSHDGPAANTEPEPSDTPTAPPPAESSPAPEAPAPEAEPTTDELALPTPEPSTPTPDAGFSPAIPGADHVQPLPVSNAPFVPVNPPAPAETPAPPTDNQTLQDIEQSVHSSHLQDAAADTTAVLPSDASAATPDLDAALKAVQDVYDSTPQNTEALPPKQDLGASGYLKVQDLPGMEGVAEPAAEPAQTEPTEPVTPPPMVDEPTPGNTPADTPLTMPMPPGVSLPPAETTPPTNTDTSAAPPPPVPPPFNPPAIPGQ